MQVEQRQHLGHLRRFVRPPLEGTSMMPPSSSSTTHDILSLQLVDDPPPVFKPVAQFTSQYYRSTIWS
jgi:hypothetical protein